MIHSTSSCRRGLLVPAALLALLLSTPAARAQYFGVSAGVPLPRYGGFPVVNPLGFNPYGFGYFQTPLNGALTGAADLTVANSIYYKNTQDARITREKSRQAMIDTRRKMIEEQLYEQSLQPNPEDIRMKEMEQALRRARNDPPRTEIWSGQALNELLRAIQSGKTQGMEGPTVPIDSSILSRINVTDGTTSAGSGVARDLTTFHWPLTLRKKDYAEERMNVEKLCRKAVEQAPSGMVDAETIEGLQNSIKALETQIGDNVLSMSPSDYTRSSRYLRELKNSFKVLEDPNVAMYFNGKRSAKGSTVSELVSNLTNEGLRFAPASTGEEAAYNTLYQALRTYDAGVARLAMSGGSAPGGGGAALISAPMR